MPLSAHQLATLMPAGRLWHSLIWAAHSWRRKLAATIDVSELIDLPPCSGIKSWDSTFNTRNRNIVYCHTLFLYSRGTDYLPFTPIQGETPPPERHIYLTWHFNPLSLYRERLFHSPFLKLRRVISIHSPYTGRDHDGFKECMRVLISIHSPYTGRDYGIIKEIMHTYISIHSPYTGRDKVSPLPDISYREFQSTLPIQGETWHWWYY